MSSSQDTQTSRPSSARCCECGGWDVFGGSIQPEPIPERIPGAADRPICPKCLYKRWIVAGIGHHERSHQVEHQRANWRDSTEFAPSGTYMPTNSPPFPSPQPQSTQLAYENAPQGYHSFHPPMPSPNPAFHGPQTTISSRRPRDLQSDRSYPVPVPFMDQTAVQPSSYPPHIAHFVHDRAACTQVVHNHYHFYAPTSTVFKMAPDYSMTDNTHGITNTAYGSARMEIRKGPVARPDQGPGSS